LPHSHTTAMPSQSPEHNSRGSSRGASGNQHPSTHGHALREQSPGDTRGFRITAPGSEEWWSEVAPQDSYALTNQGASQAAQSLSPEDSSGFIVHAPGTDAWYAAAHQHVYGSASQDAASRVHAPNDRLQPSQRRHADYSPANQRSESPEEAVWNEEAHRIHRAGQETLRNLYAHTGEAKPRPQDDRHGHQPMTSQPTNFPIADIRSGRPPTRAEKREASALRTKERREERAKNEQIQRRTQQIMHERGLKLGTADLSADLSERKKKAIRKQRNDEWRAVEDEAKEELQRQAEHERELAWQEQQLASQVRDQPRSGSGHSEPEGHRRGRSTTRGGSHTSHPAPMGHAPPAPIRQASRTSSGFSEHGHVNIPGFQHMHISHPPAHAPVLAPATSQAVTHGNLPVQGQARSDLRHGLTRRRESTSSKSKSSSPDPKAQPKPPKTPKAPKPPKAKKPKKK